MCVISPNYKAENIGNKVNAGEYIAGFEKGTIEYSFMQTMGNLNYITETVQSGGLKIIV